MDEGCGDGGGGKNSGGGGGGAGLEEDVDVGDCSEEEEEEEEDMDMGSSPIAPDHSTIASMPSPAMPYEGLASPLRVGPVALPGGGKPVMRRGPGRPRTRGGVTQPQVRTKRPIGLKLKRWKGLLVSGVYGSGNGKTSQEGELDESTSPVQPSTPVEQQIKAPIFVDEPLFSEQWPGKLCILCNLSEHSQLGQGEMLRIECSIEDLPKDIPRDLLMSPPESLPHDSTSPRQPLQIRRHKGPSKCRNAGNSGQEPVDELSLVGHVDIPEPGNIVDTGYIYIHEWCAVWCAGVNRLSSDRRRLTNVGAGVMSAVSRRCWHCWRYGAGVACAVPNCSKHFHTPCAAASAAFQHPKTLLLICNQHIDQVATMPEFNDVSCQSCDVLGNVNNLVMCSICGNHYHGACIGNALHPGLRAGWQCADCRMCQLCRISTEDSTRMLVCEACDKTYHPSCVRPAMSSVPKVGWKCKRCRLCSDCGARTPGGGLSSRWHSNYTVCDSCYQQRNKGFSCPVCHKAYRAAALREMVRCSQCQRFVHGTCDKEADFVSYHRKKEAHPDYQYICLACKNNTTDKLLVLKRKDSTEEAMLESSLSVSQESLVMGDDGDLDSEKSDEAPLRLTIGLGKGKPFCASKMAKKRLGLGVGPGRPKGSGKMSAISPLSHYQKRSRFAEFGRKRGAKPKMRGIFGVPGVGLQRPQSDCSLKTEDEPGVENKLVLCSSKDKFVLGQDMCVMCGSVGIDQEACLISCAQCGQCYHPYCVSVKVTKVMLQKGWRCLDCTVCEGCGQRNDEGRLILCDDCDISYHIYCMDPPLGSVPTGVWKCKWCAQCQTCGSDNPGVNSSWQNSCTQCGPCASRTSCPACLDTYLDGDLIIKCINCDRWLHCMCDSINTEQEAEACCSQGYTCILCRPNNMALVVPPTPIRVPSPEVNPGFDFADTKVSGADYYVDGVCLSEFGLQQIKTLSMEHFQQPVRRKRPGFKRPQEADIMATIESVVTGDQENGEGKDTGYKEGMIWGSRENGPIPSPPEGFSLFTMESGMVILKRKKQRNLQKLGIGGFTAVKMRSSRFKDEDEGFLEDKPRRKPRCNKKRSKLAESYPSYLQEAFFGRDLLDTSKEAGGQDLESSSDESDDGKSNKDELKAIEDVKSKQDRIVDNIKVEEDNSQSEKHHIKEEDEGNDGEALKDILTIPDNLLHTDLVNTIMKEQDGEIKSENILPADSAGSETPQLNDSGASQKDELSDILGPHFNLESMVRETGLPNMDSKDVEEIFKGVLTDESQESQSSGVFPLRGPTPGTPGHPQLSPQDWSERCKQILKKWRALSSEKKAPYLQQARENRTNLRMKKAQQEQDKAQAAKSCREAEQERQWKQLQAMRQQQVLTQNRPQGITKVTRQISSDGTIVQYTNEPVSTQTHLTQQLQVSTTQDSSSLPVMSPRGPPQFTSPSGAKVVRPVVGTVVASAPSGTNFPRVLRPPQPTPPQPTFTQVVPTQQQQPPPPPSVRQPIPEEMNRQLRDLLQRHHTKQDTSDGSPLLSPTVVNAPLQSGATTQLRQPITQIRPQTLHHPASQGIDARVRLLLQQQRAAVFPGQVRLATPRPHVDQFNLMSRPQQFHAIASQNAPIVRASQPPAVPAEQVRIQPVEQRIQGREGEEIPDSVTAELEKLEQEGGNIAEVEAVSAILGDLVEDDDELLAEMGADFNILEYADPELDNVSGGEKTNIFDDLEDEVEKKKHLTENRQEKTEALVKREVFDRSKTTKKVEQSPAVRSQGGEKKTEATAVVNPSVVAVVSSTTPASQPQQNTLGTQGLPQVTVAGSASFSTQFAAPTTPIPRLPALQGGVQSTGRTQVLTGAQGQGFIQIPPPPPPYPGPPPPYPGQQEQPLLLEELLEEEKREQEKQATVPQQSTGPALMSDADFEMLKADVLGTNPQVSSPPGAIQGPGLVPQPIRAPFVQRPPGTLQPQTIISRPPPPPPPPPPVETPAPPMPPDNIITEQDRQSQVQYEQWLHTNNAAVTQQLKFYETEVQKLRKVRKSLNSKQRQLRKNGNELSQRDAMELQRVTSEQAILQKYLEAARKQSRQHNMVIQEYQAKQEQKGGPGLMASGGGGGMVTVNINTGGSPQSPALMSPVLTPGGQAPMPSPQTPSVSPLHTTSPRLGTPLSQGGEDKNDTSGLPSPRPLQMTPTPPSPQQFTQRHPVMVSRFVRSPEAGMRPRMLVTQISGPSNTQVAYSAPRAFTSSPQPMSSIVVSQQNVTNQTIRLQAPQSLTPQQLLQRQQQLQQQKQQQLQQQEINQQEVSKQLQERPSLQQRQLTQEENLARQQQLHMLQRQQQLAQQNRQLLSQQGKVGQFRQILQQNQQQFTQVSHPLQSQSPLGQLQSGSTSPMVSQAQSPMPPSPIGSVQQFNTASSPMHPQSPMLPQFQPASSPMPQHSPRVQSYQTSNSPITPQSPMVYSGMQAPNSPMPQFSQPISPMPPQSPRVQQQQYTQQPPTSPMQQFPSSPMPPRSPMPHIGGSPMPMRRPSSTGGGSLASSPAERPRTPHDQQDPNCGGGGGGGNTNNPMNPIPFPPDFGRFGYFRLGLRGGSPMWGGKTPPKKPLSKSEPSTSVAHNSTDENGKMAHPMKAGSLVCLDYNDFDDESRTPPMTPPAKPALIKKAEAGGPKTRQSEDTDSEMTVYDDIVLVESCKEANLEVEELQSALKGNVMSTVVSMPVVLDPAQIQMMDVESDLLEDCLVSSDLVVLDVENGSAENDCILEVVDKETDEILILEEGIEEGLKVDESELMNNSEELMDLEEDLPSPPTGRKRMVGKVLPGEAIIKEDVKHIDDSPDSPEDDIADASPEPYLHSDMSSTKDDLFKSESHLKVQTKPRCQISEDVSSQENEDRKVINIQPNVVVSRTSVVPFTPMVTQKSYQICADRRLSLQQATVESLVQDAVNAAKLQRAAAVVSSAPEPIVNTTTNVVNSSNTVLTSVSSTVHNLSGQFIPLSVANKSDKTIKDNMVIVKECTKKDFEPHRNDTILVNMANSTCLDSNKIPDRKVIHDGIKITDITDMKADLLANDKDLKNSHENETSSERVDKFQNDDSLFDTKFTRHPWDHSTFVNRERSKFDEQFHILNDGINKIQTIKTTTNKILENKFEQDNSKEVAKPSNQNDDKEKLNVTLPCVNMSSSILEAQLTSMLRTTEQSSQPPKFVYTLINRTSTGNDVKKDVQINNDHDIHEDLRVEGLAAQFHRSIKSEELKLLADIKDETNKTTTNNNNRIQTNMKHASLYLPTSQIKSDTVVVGGKSYKIFQANSQASTSDILNICESSTADDSLKIVRSLENESPKNHLTDSVPKMTFQSSNARVHELLQQRVVSSSDKEARHISFSTAKVLHHQQKDEPKTFLQLSTMLMPQKKELPARTPEDSQNVLLKQLLQNTACATTTTAGASLSTGGGGGATVTTSGPIPPQAPPLPIVPSLEAQLARPVPPTPSALIPPVLNEPVKNSLQQQQKEVKHLIKTQVTPMEPTRLSSLDELLSPSVGQLQPSLITSQSGLTSVTQSQPPTLPPPPPPPPPPPLPPQQQQQHHHHHQQVLIKREPVTLTQPGPVMTTMVEVKKEPTPVTSPVVVEVKKEVISSDEMLSPGLRMEHEHAGEAALQDLKKTIKRRQYQQKRRQSLGKEAIGGTPKKRPRKSSKVEEDYDSFNDSLMSQLRQTPAMLICEPNLTYNFTASPIFGSGDLSKVNSSTRFGDLKGVYGAGYLPNENDYYNTLPFGDLPPHAPATPSTQRGFYNEEFAPLKLHSTKDEFDERKFDYNRERDNDTPDTVISSSSPECIMPEMAQRFPGLQLIDSEGEDDKFKISRFSPDIPIIAPLALRAKPCRMYSDMDKENEGPHGKRHCDVTVTLTLSTQASDDVLSVLRNLANVLRIPVPVNYSITERSITQPSQKLGLYRIKGKDGKEGVPVDIQSILNGAAKFCRHCDVIILNNLMKKKASEMPTIAKQGEEELYFCSSACYAQLAIAHPPAVQCEKVDSVDDVVESVPPKKIKLEDVETPRTEVKKGSPDSLDLFCGKGKDKSRTSTAMYSNYSHKLQDMSESSLYIGTRSGKKEKYSEKMTSALIPSFKKSLSRYRIWTTNSIPPPSTRHKKPTDKEIAEMLFRLGITVQPPKQPDDFRVCLFCRQIGDGVTDGPARLLNYDVNKWVHLNCALWSDEVYETVSGGLVNVEIALQNGSTVNCAYCSATGATLKCFKMRCSLVYHLPCAVKDQCIFFKNKTLYCSSHVPKGDKENELTTLSVMRRVYISRDENRQVANVMHHSEQAHLMRVGSLLFLSVGQLLPHQLQAFHTPNYIYPIGYKILRMYWSMRVTNKRCRYVCSIHETEGRPEFRIVVQERGEPDLELTDTSARGVWLKVLEPLAEKRRTDGTVQLFPKFITGEDLFGLTEPAIVRVLESLPGVETLTDYRFKYGRNPLLELPLAINPTGCARCEGRPKGHWKRGAHTQRTCSSVTSVRPACTPTTPLGGGAGGVEAACPYSKQFVHSKSSQYKKMKQEWRNNVYLARSKIQGLGLYAARDLERHTMVIEYIGEIIRTELAETREKQYEAKNRGIYMFRLDEDRVVDATLCGGLARYINHSCSPNCVAETVEVDRDVRIIIFTKRRINRGEELAYDYKFDIEDDQHKIPCNCGAPNCRKWMN